EYADTQIHHLLYLPTDWRRGRRWPVIVEYAGNKWRDQPGTVENSRLGYGISGGRGFIWVCMPYVNLKEKRNEATWWGDVDATVAYCRAAVAEVCADWGGDPAALILTGFSRGAIACNYIGLHDDAIAALWRAFIPHSHYDGVRENWPYPGAAAAAARVRLERLRGRPVFVSQELKVDDIRAYLARQGVPGDFTFQVLPYATHTDAWVLRDIPERRRLRQWLADVLARPASGAPATTAARGAPPTTPRPGCP
ncbi:MAG: hypothetical protein M1457_04300, partial [bacterium]|nr:hypothetical protein [bacterium]